MTAEELNGIDEVLSNIFILHASVYRAIGYLWHHVSLLRRFIKEDVVSTSTKHTEGERPKRQILKLQSP